MEGTPQCYLHQFASLTAVGTGLAPSRPLRAPSPDPTRTVSLSSRLWGLPPSTTLPQRPPRISAHPYVPYAILQNNNPFSSILFNLGVKPGGGRLIIFLHYADMAPQPLPARPSYKRILPDFFAIR